MAFPIRPPIDTLPSYSLTGDLLGFFSGAAFSTDIPACVISRRLTPVKLWFGQFNPCFLKESYRQVKEKRKPQPPCTQVELDEILNRIDRRLAARNIRCWSDESEELGRRRASSAVNDLGPLLFLLINQAEVRVRGARKLPDELKGIVTRDIERYEMIGVIDVVTQVELFNPKFRGNGLLELVVEELPTMPLEEFEVIVGYKGMKRPDLS